MPIIEHGSVPMPRAVNLMSERTLVSPEVGSSSLIIKELELHPGWEGKLHTHPHDAVLMVTEGAVQMLLGDDLQTVRAGATMLAPPGVPHQLMNKLWIPVRLLVIYPTDRLETDYA